MGLAAAITAAPSAPPHAAAAETARGGGGGGAAQARRAAAALRRAPGVCFRSLHPQSQLAATVTTLPSVPSASPRAACRCLHAAAAAAAAAAACARGGPDARRLALLLPLRRPRPPASSRWCLLHSA